MKFTLLAALFSLLFIPAAFGQDFDVPVTVSDGTNNIDLIIGVDPSGTAGFDQGLDTYAPPAPPAGAFDARLSTGGEDYLVDIRGNALTEKTFVATYQAASGEGPIVLSWDSAALASLGSFVLVDNINGSLYGPVDMTTTSSINLATDDPDNYLSSGVRILVTPANNPPNAADDAATVGEDGQVNIDVLANDSDPEGRALTVTSVGEPTSGSVTIEQDGTITYAPDADFHGSDSFTYTISDGSKSAIATVSVTVDSVNDAPAASDDTVATNEDESVVVDVLANDSDVDGTLDVSTVTIVDAPASGSASVDVTTGAITYTPPADGSGTFTFTYTVGDNGGATSNAATVTVTVASVNDAPIAVDDEATTDEDIGVSVDVVDNDTDVDGDALTVTEVTEPANGVATIEAGGSVTYVPNPDFHGTDTFDYTVSDGTSTASARVTVTVAPVNDAPAFTSQPVASAGQGAAYSYAITTEDADGDAVTLAAPTLPSWLSFTDNGDGTGSLSGTPGGADMGDHDVVLEVSDGQTAAAQQAFTITVSTNQPPALSDDAVEVDEDSQVNVDVLANDSDAEGDALAVTEVTSPANGAATIEAGGSVTYVPNPDFHGTDTFDYTVSDGASEATARVTVTVTPLNDAPVAVGDEAATDEDKPVVIDVLANDKDIDGDTLLLSLVEMPRRGTAEVDDDDTPGDATDDLLRYLPDENFSGSDTLVYQVEDAAGAVATARVIITVEDVNDVPVFGDVIFTQPEDGAVISIGGAPGDEPLDPEAPFVVQWEEADDPEGASVSYVWQLSATEAFASLLASEEVGAETRYETTLRAIADVLAEQDIQVGDSLVLYHRVEASDGDTAAVSDAAQVTLVRGILVGVEENGLPEAFALEQNYPNPFQRQTTIQFALPEPSEAVLSIFDVMGREVARLAAGQYAAGRHEVQWSGRDAQGQALASGVYIYRLEAGEHMQTRTITLVR